MTTTFDLLEEHEKTIAPVQTDRCPPLLGDEQDERDVESFDALCAATKREPRELMLAMLTNLRNVVSRWEQIPVALDLSQEDERLMGMVRVHLENACSCMRVLQGPTKSNPPVESGQGAPPGGSIAGATAKKPYVPPTLTHLGSVRDLTMGGGSPPPHRPGPFPR